MFKVEGISCLALAEDSTMGTKRCKKYKLIIKSHLEKTGKRKQ